MKSLAKWCAQSLPIVLILSVAYAGDPLPRTGTLTAETVATYRAIAISRFEQMQEVRRLASALRARGYALYAEPTAVLLNADCESQVDFCNPVYLVTQGAVSDVGTHIEVIGATIAPTTFFGSEDHIIPPGKMARLRALLTHAQ